MEFYKATTDVFSHMDRQVLGKRSQCQVLPGMPAVFQIPSSIFLIIFQKMMLTHNIW